MIDRRHPNGRSIRFCHSEDTARGNSQKHGILSFGACRLKQLIFQNFLYHVINQPQKYPQPDSDAKIFFLADLLMVIL